MTVGFFSKFTFNVDTTDLLLHDLCVDLTHVTTFIRSLELADLQPPVRVIVHGYVDSSVFGHHPIVQAQNSLIFCFQPTDLSNNKI